jgi:hypothetical protein
MARRACRIPRTFSGGPGRAELLVQLSPAPASVSTFTAGRTPQRSCRQDHWRTPIRPQPPRMVWHLYPPWPPCHGCPAPSAPNDPGQRVGPWWFGFLTRLGFVEDRPGPCATSFRRGSRGHAALVTTPWLSATPTTPDPRPGCVPPQFQRSGSPSVRLFRARLRESSRPSSTQNSSGRLGERPFPAMIPLGRPARSASASTGSMATPGGEVPERTTAPPPEARPVRRGSRCLRRLPLRLLFGFVLATVPDHPGGHPAALVLQVRCLLPSRCGSRGCVRRRGRPERSLQVSRSRRDIEAVGVATP